VANIIYTKGQAEAQEGDLSWDSGVIRVLLERDTSVYLPDRRNDFLDSFIGGGGVEISCLGYVRQTLTNCNIVINDALDRVELQCGNIDFGRLPGGQTVKGALVYLQVGGDDSTPEDDPLIAYFGTDNDNLLPVALAGSVFSITPASGILIKVEQGN
jgi:hypothetical protein